MRHRPSGRGGGGDVGREGPVPEHRPAPEVTLSGKETETAFAPVAQTIVSAVQDVLERTPPELAADVAVSGILLTGGREPACGGWTPSWPRRRGWPPTWPRTPSGRWPWGWRPPSPHLAKRQEGGAEPGPPPAGGGVRPSGLPGGAGGPGASGRAYPTGGRGSYEASGRAPRCPPTRQGVPISPEKWGERAGASPWTPFYSRSFPLADFLLQLSLQRSRGYFLRYTKTDLGRIFEKKHTGKHFLRKKVSKSGYVCGHRNSPTTGTMWHPTPKRASGNERAIRKRGGAGATPPRLFASGLSLEKAWIPRPGPGGKPRCRSGPAPVPTGPPADNDRKRTAESSAVLSSSYGVVARLIPPGRAAAECAGHPPRRPAGPPGRTCSSRPPCRW